MSLYHFMRRSLKQSGSLNRTALRFPVCVRNASRCSPCRLLREDGECCRTKESHEGGHEFSTIAVFASHSNFITKNRPFQRFPEVMGSLHSPSVPEPKGPQLIRRPLTNRRAARRRPAPSPPCPRHVPAVSPARLPSCALPLGCGGDSPSFDLWFDVSEFL